MSAHLLFDIDGTLIDSCPPHGQAINAAVREVYGMEVTHHGIQLSGMTDWQIVREMLTRVGVSLQEIDASMPALVKRASDIFCDMARADDVKELPHAKATVLRLHSAGYHLSLVTGNFVRIAHRKMELVGLDASFPSGIGGFGCDHFHRPELPKVAITRAKERYKTTTEQAFIIGDTLRDVEAGKVNQIPVIAVGTGRNAPGLEQFKSAGAAFAIKDLSEFPWGDFGGVKAGK